MPRPVLGWDEKVLVANETTFGTQPLPASTQGLEVASLDMGPVQQGVTRPKKDKTAGRDMTLGHVEGRVEPMPFTLETSVKSRALATTPAKEAALLKAAGLVETVGGANVTYGLSSAPAEAGLTVLRAAGGGSDALLAEAGMGGVVRQLVVSGGDSELMLRAVGAFASKAHLGQAVGSIASAVATNFTLATPAEAYRFAPGYYQCEAEVVLVTAVDYATGVLTVVRAQATTVAAIHTAKPLYPYVPNPAVSGSPISEANVVVTLDGVATRCTRFSVDITTGIDFLPLATGSRFVQGTKALRVDVKPSLELVLTDELVALLGKASQRKAVALSILCGTGAGGQVTLSMPYCELEPFAAPLPANDVVTVSPTLRVRGNAGNDSLLLTWS